MTTLPPYSYRGITPEEALARSVINSGIKDPAKIREKLQRQPLFRDEARIDRAVARALGIGEHTQMTLEEWEDSKSQFKRMKNQVRARDKDIKVIAHNERRSLAKTAWLLATNPVHGLPEAEYRAQQRARRPKPVALAAAAE